MLNIEILCSEIFLSDYKFLLDFFAYGPIIIENLVVYGGGDNFNAFLSGGRS